jgi:mRNA interferase RelE/StbE
MDKIAKALENLSVKERELIKNILLKVKGNSLINLDVKKLKGYDDIFRVRKGKLRIIFKREKAGHISILTIERRSDNTYSKF